MSYSPGGTAGLSTPRPTGRSGRTSLPPQASRTTACTPCGTQPPPSPWTRASPWPSFRRCSATPISGSRADTPTSRRCWPRTQQPESGGPCSGKLLPKLLPSTMIISAILAFVLVRWSRLSESNRRPIHYEWATARYRPVPRISAGSTAHSSSSLRFGLDDQSVAD
jgi:hypothetical protein